MSADVLAPCARCKLVPRSGKNSSYCKPCRAEWDREREAVYASRVITEKRCPACEEVKPASEFRPNKRRNGGLDTYCHPCRRHKARTAWRSQAAENRIGAHLKRTFGITVDDYRVLFADQGGVCAICGEPETLRDKFGTVRSLSVDHCHETGAIRGLLCTGCNVSLGRMNDDPQRLRAAADYLERARV